MRHLVLCVTPWLLPGAAFAVEKPAVTFYRHIAPILYRECTPCHRPGESGPFSLLTYDDARRRAAQIARATKQRFMPPWLPEPGHGEFQDERRLTEAQIQLIQDWVKLGAPAGPIAQTPPAPKFPAGWQLGPPDLILRAARPYVLPADGGEAFWNFILPVPVTTTRWVRAIEVRPGNPRAFRHANVIIDRSHAARRRATTAGGGFPGMDRVLEEETFDPDGHFLSWKPGTGPVVEPDGMAWRASPGMDLVLNVHLRPTGKQETVSPMVGLYFTDQPQTKFPLLVQLEHDGALDIPPGEKDFVVKDEFKVGMDLNVLAVYPHAHYIARVMEGYATLPDGSRQWLVRIPDWDLNWQGVFRLKKPLLLPRDSVITMEYHYDNSAGNVRNPNSPPKRITGGNDAKSEMSHFWLQVLPVEAGDQRAVLQEAIAKQRLQKYPDDFIANYNMGDLLLNQSKPEEAIPHFEAAAKADPRSALAAAELGVALFAARKTAEAEVQFTRALTIDPSYTDARFNLASVQATTGKWEEAVTTFRQVLEERLDYAKAHTHLGAVLTMWGDSFAQSGDDDKALARYRDALNYRPDDVQIRGRIGMTLARMERLDESLAEFEAILKVDPNLQAAKQAIEAIRARKKAVNKD